MMKTIHDCKTCREALPDLLLDGAYAASHPAAAQHMSDCAACRTEFAELRATFNLLDGWKAPEPSPYFDARLHVRLRETAAAAPEGLWERARAFFLFSTKLSMRPALAGALGFALLLGGGAVAGIHEHEAATVNQAASPAVNDLKIMDNNAQALQQMDQLLDDSGPKTNNSGAPPVT
jgi:predicted anti-sigma-YlaC factor YlaD